MMGHFSRMHAIMAINDVTYPTNSLGYEALGIIWHVFRKSYIHPQNTLLRKTDPKITEQSLCQIFKYKLCVIMYTLYVTTQIIILQTLYV